jgi:hypothetical protein
MRSAFLVLGAFSLISLPAFGQAAGDEGRYFHLKPPSYTIPHARKQAIHKYAEALRWYRQHLGDTPLSTTSYIQGINVTSTTVVK